MATMVAAGEGISADETPLLNDVVSGSVDFKGRPSLRSKSGGCKAASFIVGVEMAERFAYYGISSNLVNYLTAALGQPTAAAAANLNAWYGTAALSPILGALLADSWLGRYSTIICSSLLYIVELASYLHILPSRKKQLIILNNVSGILKPSRMTLLLGPPSSGKTTLLLALAGMLDPSLKGLGFLTLSSAFNSCKIAANNKPCSPTTLHTTFFFFFSLYVIALAQGGHKPCVQAFGADQFDVKNRKECEAKSSYFNWFFWFSCFGTVLALSVVPYIQENLSWELGFAVPSFTMFVALVVFWIGTITYRFNCETREQEAQRVLEECPLIDSVEDEKTSRRVEEARAILRLAPIWCTSLGYSIVYAQPSTLFTKQATTLDRHITSNFQIPAASLQLCISLSIMFFVSMYDFVLVPVARSITKSPSGISKIQRIGIGLILSLTSIVIAAVVERKRLSTAREHGLVDDPTVMIPMSVWWLAPQYLLSGMSDVFGMVGLQELFYDQVPSKLKSVGLALYLSILGVGSLMSSFLISFIQNVTSRNGEEGWFSNNLNRAHLDYFYWVLAGLSAGSLAAYLYIAKSFVYSRKFTA